MNLTITNAQLYTKQQTLCQRISSVIVVQIISGLEFMKVYDPAGYPVAEAFNNSLLLLPPDFSLKFSFSKERKNYAVISHIDCLNWNPQSGKIELKFHDQTIEVPVIIRVPPTRREQIRELFQRITVLSESPLPSDSKTAELLMCSIIAEFAEQSGSSSKEKIPEMIVRLRQEIDNDKEFLRPLSEIMKQFPVTDVHLRRLFQKHYQTNPAEYRNILRFSRIKELLSETDMSFKEIADIVGMNHVTHLYSFLKQRCGLTPAELRKNLRM